MQVVPLGEDTYAQAVSTKSVTLYDSDSNDVLGAVFSNVQLEGIEALFPKVTYFESGKQSTIETPLQLAPIPLPSALPLALSALGVLGVQGFRRKK